LPPESRRPGWRAAQGLLLDLLGLFFPARCRICNQPLDGISRLPICPNCWLDATRSPDKGLCNICGLPGGPVDVLLFQCAACIEHAPHFAMARSFGEYGGALRELVHLLKYNGMTPLAKPLGERLASVAERPAWRGEFAACEAIVAVPLEAGRRRSRGYNQAELLARVVAKRLGLPLLPARAFRRVRATASQAGLTRPQRRENVRGAFEADGASVKGRQILVIDDVMTTGATLDACAVALRQAGAKRVLALSVARTPEPMSAPGLEAD
jgi:ComF family protein